jgi:hypothetical protein
MNGHSENPARLKDQHDQPNLVERIAGQAARDMSELIPLSATAMARVAARIDGRRSQRHGLRLGWVLAMGSFLLGIATVAWAAHLDLVPRWITRIVQGEPNPPPPARPALKARGMVRRSPPIPGGTPTAPEPSVDQLAVSSAPELLPAPVDEVDISRWSAGRNEIAPKSPLAPVDQGQVAPSQPVEPGQRAGQGKRDGKLVASSRPEGAGHRGTSRLAVMTDKMSASSAGRQPLPRVGEPAGPATISAETAAWPQVAEPAPAPTVAPGPREQPAPVAPASPGRAARPSSSQAAPAPPNPTARHLKEIVHALRVEHSSQQALALLDRYANELAGSAFAEESLLLRVEAMLGLGQQSAVLRLLDGTSLTDVAASRVLLITRGELRAAANRCAEGIGDFDLVLARARRPPKQALLGRARCKQKLGDTAGAASDFDRYRREFPGDPLSGRSGAAPAGTP